MNPDLVQPRRVVATAIVVIAVVVAFLLASGDDPATAPLATEPPVTEPPTTAPATIAPSTTATSTTAPATTASGAQFVEAFDGNAGLERFDRGVYHRNIGAQTVGQAPSIWGDGNAIHGGSWTADHDLACGTPDTQRPLSSAKGSPVDFRIDELTYTCRDHMMSSVGDVDAYTILWFSPNQTFPSVSEVCIDVNLTDLGTRQWLKIGVVTDARYRSTQTSWLGTGSLPGFLASDVGAANLPGELQTSDATWITYGGGASAGVGRLMIGNGAAYSSTGFTAGNDKATRYPVCITDTAAGLDVAITTPEGATVLTASQPGADLPAGPARVVFATHGYTPTKSETGYPIGFTFHWDNVVVT